MKKRFSNVLISVLISITIAVSAIHLTNEVSAEEQTGSLLGYVYNEGQQTPVEGALVFIDGNETVWETDKGGMFSIDDLAFGNYSITVWAEGYNFTYIDAEFDTNGTVLDVPMREDVPSLLSVIRGNVYLENRFETIDHTYTAGDAVVGFNDEDGLPLGGLIDVEETDDELVGEYVQLISPGTYYLYAFAYSHHVENSMEITVGSSEIVTYDFHLTALDMHNSGLAGNVTDSSTGLPVEDVLIIASNIDEGVTLTTYTDEDGFFYFSTPLVGDYVVTALHLGYEPGHAAASVIWDLASYVDIALNSTQNSTILWGFVHGDGAALPDASVFTDYHLVVSADHMDVDGLYIIMDFPGGVETQVGAVCEGFYPHIDEVTVPAGSIQRHDFFMQSTGNGGNEKFTNVFVRVFDVFGDPAPLYGATVGLTSEDYSSIRDLSSSSNTMFFELVPSYESMMVSSSRIGYEQIGYILHPETEIRLPYASFDTTIDPIMYIDVHMNMSGQGNNETMIWGYVFSESLGGEPISEAEVMFLYPDTDISTETSPMGYYEFIVEPGDYTHIALPMGHEEVFSYDHATSTHELGPWSGSVAESESRHVDFYLKERTGNETGSLVGLVHMMDMAPVPDYYLKATDDMMSMTEPTDTHGYFEFSPLSAGSYELTSLLDVYIISHISYHSSTGASGIVSPPILPSDFMVPAGGWVFVNITVTQDVVEDGHLEIKVLELGLGTPIEDATVKVTDMLSTEITETTDPSGSAFFDLEPRDYSIRASRSGYFPSTGSVSITSGSDIVVTIFLYDGTIEPFPGPIHINLKDYLTGEPIRDMSVKIAGAGSGKSDENGDVTFKLHGEGRFNVAFASFVVVAIATDDEYEDLEVEKDGTYHFIPGHNYTFQLRTFDDIDQLKEKESNGDEEEEIPIALIAMAAIIALIVGIAVGFIARRNKGNEYPEE